MKFLFCHNKIHCFALFPYASFFSLFIPFSRMHSLSPFPYAFFLSSLTLPFPFPFCNLAFRFPLSLLSTHLFPSLSSAALGSLFHVFIFPSLPDTFQCLFSILLPPHIFLNLSFTSSLSPMFSSFNTFSFPPLPSSLSPIACYFLPHLTLPPPMLLLHCVLSRRKESVSGTGLSDCFRP